MRCTCATCTSTKAPEGDEEVGSGTGVGAAVGGVNGVNNNNGLSSNVGVALGAEVLPGEAEVG